MHMDHSPCGNTSASRRYSCARSCNMTQAAHDSRVAAAARSRSGNSQRPRGCRTRSVPQGHRYTRDRRPTIAPPAATSAPPQPTATGAQLTRCTRSADGIRPSLQQAAARRTHGGPTLRGLSRGHSIGVAAQHCVQQAQSHRQLHQLRARMSWALRIPRRWPFRPRSWPRHQPCSLS